MWPGHFFVTFIYKTPVTQYNASAPSCTCADIYCSNHTGLSLHISGTDPGTVDSGNLTLFSQRSNRLDYCESRSYYIYKHERLEAKPWTQHDFVLYYHPTSVGRGKIKRKTASHGELSTGIQPIERRKPSSTTTQIIAALTLQCCTNSLLFI